ncbi:MAG: CRTAC1 family protein [Planctomyces sp.]|nr:CRTAC1 family protein [Planctomyces sp.]
MIPACFAAAARLRFASPPFLCALILIFSGCKPEPASTREPTTPEAAVETPSDSSRDFGFKPAQGRRAANDGPPTSIGAAPRFVDVAAERGIKHVYDNGASPRALMVESTGGGAGWFDFDRDGLLDLMLTQGGRPDAPPNEARPPDACYRQLPGGTFVDVAALAGVGDRGFGHGVAIGDVDNDGFDDLFIANSGRSSLYLNQGDGTFVLASEMLEGKRDVWSSTAAWGDVNKDGLLDLYVCNYAIYDPYRPVECRDKDGNPAICHPRNVEPEPDEFFQNSGDGRLVESSQLMGLFGPGNKALGVVIADLDGDDWPDIYVANDTTANFVFINRAGTSFRESAVVLGGAYSATGEPQASMGIAFGDYDRNGYPDLCLTHFTGEHYTLYQNLGPQGLQDVSARTRMREATLPKLGFGTVMQDFNRNGRMDLLFANGHIDPKFEESEGYEMRPQLMAWDGQRWHDVSSTAGEYFQRKSVGRAVATADFDGDGALDVCIVHHNSPTALLRNESEAGRGVSVGLIGVHSNRSGINAKVSVRFGEQQLTSELAGGTSYAASHQRRLFFGLGDWTGPLEISVQWPSGVVDAAALDGPDQAVTILEGAGAVRLATPTP